jgi:ribulose-phosphate 3-epimerase
VIPKIKKARELIERRGLDIDLEVDGGLNEDNVPSVVKAGANVLVAGYSVFGGRGIAESIRLLRERAKKAVK